MVNGEIIERVQSILNKGVQSDDARLPDPYVFNVISTVKTLIIKRKIKGEKISDWMKSYLPVVILEPAAIVDDECLLVPLPPGCKLLRSTCDLPAPLSNANGHMIDYVSTLNGNTLDKLDFVSSKYRSGNKYSSNKEGYYIQNKRLWVVGQTPPRAVFVVGLFHSDEEVVLFNSECCKSSNSTFDKCVSMYDRDFKMDTDMIPLLIEMSVKEISQSQIFKEDISNNARDNNPEESKQ